MTPFRPSIIIPVLVALCVTVSAEAQRYSSAGEATAAFKTLVTKRMTSRAEMGARNDAVGQWLLDRTA